MDDYDWLLGEGSETQSSIEEEENLSPESPDEPIWITKDGKEIPLSKMTNSHICNCINLLKGNSSRTARKWLTIFTEEINKRRSSPLQRGFSL